MGMIIEKAKKDNKHCNYCCSKRDLVLYRFRDVTELGYEQQIKNYESLPVIEIYLCEICLKIGLSKIK